MGFFCMVSGCKKECYPGCGLTFHRLPTNESERNAWIAVISGKPTKCSVICSLHFKHEDYVTQARKRLKPGAIPSVFPTKNKDKPQQPSSISRKRKLEKSFSGPGAPGCSTSAADDSRGSGGEAASWQHADHPPGDEELNSADDFSDDSTLYETVRAQPEPSAERQRAPSNVKVAEQLHEGIQCSACSGDIAGFRYTCVQCADYDLCAACEAKGVHALHYVLRVPGPRPYNEIQAVVERIRRELMSGMHAVVPADADDNQDADSVKVEVKLEAEDPGPDPLQVTFEPVGSEQRPPRNILERPRTGITIEEQVYKLDIDARARSEVLTHTTHRGDGRTPASGRAQHSYVPAARPPNRKLIEINTSAMKRPTVSQIRPISQGKQKRLNAPQKRPNVTEKSQATKKSAVADAQDDGKLGFQVFTHSRGSKAGSASDAAAQPGTSATFVHKQKAPGEGEKNASNNK